MIRKQKLWIWGVLILFLSSCSKPIADFLIEPSETKEAPAIVRFVNKSEKATTYTWNFGDGNRSSETSPMHKFYNSGQYTIILTAMDGNKKTSTKKNITIKAPEKCLIEISTPFGSMLVHLFDETPLHRDNFLKLANQGFYDSLLFHRVIEGFMIQGGDPNSKNAAVNVPLGGGSPGYQLKNEIQDNLIHIKGALAAARTGDHVNPDKKSSGSQFYIVHGNPVNQNMLRSIELRNNFNYSDFEKNLYLTTSGGTPFLDRQYTVFGQVVEGLEVIDEIAKVATNRNDRPLENIEMTIKVIK